MIDERLVAYTLMDYNQLLKELFNEKLITENEYDDFKKVSNKIMKITGFKKK